MSKVAILGARGIPACYSGYDTLVEEVATGLVSSFSDQVIVYCRSGYYKARPSSWRGVELVYLPCPRGIKAAESLIHSLISSLHVLTTGADVVYFLDPANAPFCVLLRCLGKRIVIHTDGLGWKRRKWGPVARRYYKAVEWVCAKVANALVTDNPAMQTYYQKEYRCDTLLISYGAATRYGRDNTIYPDLGVGPKRYILVVARLEPENNVDLIIEQYVLSNVDVPLVIVGNAPYGPQYLERLRRIANESVIFAGRIDDQAKLNALYAGAYLYIHGHEVGGTNPSLLRAMASGTAPVVVNVPFNVSVIADTGRVFEKANNSLSELLRCLVQDEDSVQRYGERAKIRTDEEYRWDTVVSLHHDMFSQISAGGRSRQPEIVQGSLPVPRAQK
jgi:glycosyltransferase involved in cell wall biosynthesis